MGAKKTILLVEDEAILALRESKELERKGYEVRIVHRGEAAVKLVRENPAIDLVLMDIDLGYDRMDGTEAARMILDYRDVPIVFLSSHTEPEVVERTEKITSYGYVVKNSGIVVLDASIKMAFRLFDARQRELEREATLQITLQTSRDIVESIPSGLYIYQYSEPENLVLLDANPAAEKITGKSIELCRGMEFNAIWPEAESAGIKDSFLDAIKTGINYETEDLYYSDEQLEGAFRVRAFGMPGNRLGVAFENIIERKRTDEKLHESEERYRLIYQSAGIGVGYYSVDGTVIGYNEIALKHIGKTSEEVVGRSFYDLFPEETAGEFTTRLQSAESSDSPEEYVDQVQLPGGDVWFLSVYSAVRNSSGRILGIQIMSVDITRQKNDEERIRELLAEKELLMREVHHRVKNNMLTIKDLIALQKESTDNSSARKAMEAAENRLTSIMLLYKKLYRSEQITEISAQEYLAPLIDEVVATHAVEVQVTKSIADWAIPVQIASPLGIIINELISNAMKHAFEPAKENLLEIGLEKTGKLVTVTISDNGNNPEFEASAGGFGLNLVHSLADQINGEFRIEQNHGTRTILSFTVE